MALSRVNVYVYIGGITIRNVMNTRRKLAKLYKILNNLAKPNRFV